MSTQRILARGLHLGLFYLRYAAHRTHYLGPFGQRADIALPSSSWLVARFFIPGPGNHPRHAFLLNRPEGLNQLHAE
nr:MAG TPA: hypothetical protein [Caudoviricetes sp.]